MVLVVALEDYEVLGEAYSHDRVHALVADRVTLDSVLASLALDDPFVGLDQIALALPHRHNR